MKKYIGLVAVFLLLLVAAQAFADLPRKSVLYINSYHDGYRWSDETLDGIRSVLDHGDFDIDLQIEYMDAKKYDVQTVTNQMEYVFKKKFAHERFDVVIVSDNDALNFMLKKGRELMPDVPVVFCGINDWDGIAGSKSNMTGVVENFPLQDTIDLALRLHPEKKRMVIVGDRSTTGITIGNQVASFRDKYKDRLTFEFWTDKSLPQILNDVRQLPPDTFLFFIPFYKYAGGRFFSAEEVVSNIYKFSSVPIYSAWKFLIGYGTLGGKLISGFDHGRIAAEMAMRILKGESLDSISVVRETSYKYIFDYNVMKKLGVKQPALPANTVVINSPKAFYELPKELFWTFILGMIVSMVLMGFLIRNINERKKFEKSLSDQLSFQEVLMDTIPQLVCWKDSRQHYLGANRSFTDFFGLQGPNSIVNQSDISVLKDAGNYADWANSLDREVYRNKKPVRKVRTRALDKTGETVWLEITKVPLFDRKGNIFGTLSTAENITKERNLERQLLQSQKMEAIGTLAGGIAHDFNNILTSIINSTELALGDIEEGTITYKDLERVLTAAGRGSNVVKQILAFSRPSQEGFQTTDMCELSREVLGLVKASLPRNIEVKSTIDCDVPPVMADPTQLHQVVLNLCTNSFQALRGDGGILELTLNSIDLGVEEAGLLNLNPGRYVRLSVADDGPGVPASIMDKIFDPFFTTKGKAEGTGLGLAVVHGIVKGHNGSIQVKSKPWERTEFEIFLPAGVGFDKKSEVAESGMVFGRGNILFVEDDEDQLNTTPRVLESLGFDVVATSDALKAMTMIADEPEKFDLLITDFDMPDTNGVELAKSIAEFVPALPVILVSGREDAATAAAGMPNIKRMVIKPYNKIQLANAIGSVLGAEQE